MRWAGVQPALGLLLSLMMVPARQGTQISSSLSRTTILTGETTLLTVSVQTDGHRPEGWSMPEPPAGVSVVGSSDETQMSFGLPGSGSYVVRRSYQLLGLRPGVYTLAAVGVIVNGQQYRTAEHTLTVLPAGSGAGPGTGGGSGTGAGAGSGAGGGGSPGGGGGVSGVVFHAALRPRTVYVGQQTTLEAQARFSGDIRSRMEWAPEFVPPDAPGFWIQDLKDGSSVASRITGSELVFEIHTYRRAYFPLSAGDFRLAPAILDYNIRSGFFGQAVPRELTSDSLRVHVLPLPTRGQPAGFSGAVGSYTMEASLQPTRVPVGETAVLKVTIHGTGNIKALPVPSLANPPDAQIYPPSQTSNLTDEQGMVVGSKTFSWAIVPSRTGVLDIGRATFAYFDPGARRYRVLRSDSMVLDVTPGAVAGAPPVAQGIAALSPLRYSRGSDDPLGWVRSLWFGLLQLVPLILGALLIVEGRRRRRPRRPSARSLRAERLAAVDALREMATSGGRSFFVDTEQRILAWLAERLDDAALAAGDPQRVRERLDAHGISEGTARRCFHLLVRLRESRFAPDPPTTEACQGLVDEAAGVMEAVDQQAARPKRSAGAANGVGAGVVGGVVALLLLGAPGRAVAQAPHGRFEAGVTAFRERRFEQARDDFGAYAAAHPWSTSALYDYGLAAERAGRHGEAVWAWLRTLRLNPRDWEARQNLAAIGVGPDLVDDAVPTLPLNQQEGLLLASVLWLLGSGLLIGWLRVRHRGLAGAGAASIVLAALVAASVAFEWFLPTPAVVVHDQAALRVAPDTRASVRRRLEAGAGLTVQGERPGWMQVETGDGTQGWVGDENARIF